MCSQFGISISAKALKKNFSIQIKKELENLSVDSRLQGYLKTDQSPVFIWENNELVLKMMNWSLCPHWAKEYPFKPSTYNARLERPSRNNHNISEYIYQVPSFRDAFNKGNTCLVPMNYAVESSYFGSHAGNIIKIMDQNASLFLATGIYSDWVDRNTGELIETFTLLTDEPDTQIFGFGHDRSLVLIDEEDHLEWLSKKGISGKQRLEWLRDNRTVIQWKADIDRPLKDGWKRRAPNQEEIEEIKRKVWQS